MAWKDRFFALLRGLLAFVHYPVVRLVLRLRWEGTENVPLEGPAVLCANHSSYLDPPVLYIPIFFCRRFRKVRFMALEQYFSGPTGWYVRLYDSFPVKESGVGSTAIRMALRTLREGRLLGIFPEGARTLDGSLQPFRPGAAHIAIHAGVPIIPVTINGAYDAWPPHGKLGWGRVEVIYHPPIPTDPSRARDDLYHREIMERVREAIASRWKAPATSFPSAAPGPADVREREERLSGS